jgi:DNA repair photolyase
MSKKRKTGTREWADSNYNIGTGCAHDCLYCYAKTNAVKFGEIGSDKDWTTETVKEKLPVISKKNGWTMFPTTHDITPFYLPSALKALEELLKKGNNVLIVSKPHLECIKTICEAMKNYKDKILFRFTIGTTDDEKLTLWEPYAPHFDERFLSLIHAHTNGFSTSVSMEPMLDTIYNTLYTYKKLAPFVTDKIWIGKMNKIESRVEVSSKEIWLACKKIEREQNDESIMWLVDVLEDDPKIAWKDSIKEVIERNENKI